MVLGIGSFGSYNRGFRKLLLSPGSDNLLSKSYFAILAGGRRRGEGKG